VVGSNVAEEPAASVIFPEDRGSRFLCNVESIILPLGIMCQKAVHISIKTFHLFIMPVLSFISHVIGELLFCKKLDGLLTRYVLEVSCKVIGDLSSQLVGN
jgi:hypothetical protein